jgi:hypothetical protein
MVLWFAHGTHIYTGIILLKVIQDGSDEHALFRNQNHPPWDVLEENCLLQCCIVRLHVGWSLGTKIVHLWP